MTPSDMSTFGTSTNSHTSINGNAYPSANGNGHVFASGEGRLSANIDGSPESSINVSDFQEDSLTPIAVVGMAGRFPGDASDPEKLWDLIVKART